MFGQAAPDRGLSPSFIIGLVALLFLITAQQDWGSSSPDAHQAQAVRVESQALVREKVRLRVLTEGEAHRGGSNNLCTVTPCCCTAHAAPHLRTVAMSPLQQLWGKGTG